MIGAGGNGSVFLTHLCRIHQAWTRLGGAPFAITLYDPDVVTESNLSRQVFCQSDIGCNKASVLAQRAGAFFGIQVKSMPTRFSGYGNGCDLYVGCVDTIKSRKAINDAIPSDKYDEENRPGAYWLDMGNGLNTGQVVLGGNGLPTVFDVYPQMTRLKEKTSAPSCSMEESLARQDLFINSTLATLAGQLLWRLMRQGGINHHGYVVNLNSGRVLPLAIK